MVFGSIVSINQQSGDPSKPFTLLVPPLFQSIDNEITGDYRSTQVQEQRERNQATGCHKEPLWTLLGSHDRN